MLPSGSRAPGRGPVGDCRPARRRAAGAVRGAPGIEVPEPRLYGVVGAPAAPAVSGVRVPVTEGEEAEGSPSRRSRRRGRRCSFSPRTGAGRFLPGRRRRNGTGPRSTKRRAASTPGAADEDRCAAGAAGRAQGSEPPAGDRIPRADRVDTAGRLRRAPKRACARAEELRCRRGARAGGETAGGRAAVSLPVAVVVPVADLADGRRHREPMRSECSEGVRGRRECPERNERRRTGDG